MLLSRIVKQRMQVYDADNKLVIEAPAFAAPVPVEDETPETAEEDPAVTIRREAEKLRKDADIALEKARRDADITRAKAMQDGEKLKADAAMQGAIEGQKKGYDEGAARAKKLEDDARAVLEDAKKQRDDTLNGLEDEIIQVIGDVTAQVAGAAALCEPEIIRYLVRRAMGESSRTGQVRARISPEDYASADNDEFIASLSGGERLALIKDSGLNAGDCVLETDFGNIDISIDTQLAGLKKNLAAILAADREEKKAGA